MKNSPFEVLKSLGFSGLKDLSDREHLPGEVWSFDTLEVHAFNFIFRAVKPFIYANDPVFKEYLRAFYEKEKELNNFSNKNKINTPMVMATTPGEREYGFFTSLVPLFEILVKIDILKTYKIRDLEKQLHQSAECEMGESCQCPQASEELPCGHTIREHVTVLKGWYEREIVFAGKFAASRLAVQKIPYEERYSGKQILARSDLEWMAEERAMQEIESTYFSESMNHLVQGFINIGHSRKDADKEAQKIKEKSLSNRKRELIEEWEKLFRVID